MNKLLLVLPLAVLAAVVLAVSGWVTVPRRPLDARSLEAPSATVTLSRTARIGEVPLRLDIALLRRAGRTVTLDLALRSTAARGSEAFAIEGAFGATPFRYDLSGVYLLDPATGARLPVRRDRGCVCSATDGVDVAPGGSTILSASFPAPSPEADALDVVVPHFGAFRDVPLREG